MIVKLLRKYRQQCEREAGLPASDIEVPIAHVLQDICRLLKLPPRDQEHLVGKHNLKRQEDIVWAPKPNQATPNTNGKRAPRKSRFVRLKDTRSFDGVLTHRRD